MARKNKNRRSKKSKASSTPNPSPSRAAQRKPPSAAPQDDLRARLEANPMIKAAWDLDRLLSGIEQGDPNIINTVNTFVKMGLVDKPLTTEEMAAQDKRDVELFKEYTPQDDCPVCLLPLPLRADHIQIKLCCGAIIRYGCHDAILDKKEGDICPICNVKTTTSNIVELTKKRVELNDTEAMTVLAHIYQQGTYGVTVNRKK
jgi:hypothetical protein